MKVWVLTFANATEFDGVFSSREKARDAFDNTVKENDCIVGFSVGEDEDEDFAFFNILYEDGEKDEAIIQAHIVDEGV